MTPTSAITVSCDSFTEFVDDATAPVSDGPDEIIVVGESKRDRNELGKEAPISPETARPK